MRMEADDVGNAGMGFVPTVTDKKPAHECSFNPFPNASPYYKRGDTDRAYLTLGCQCGSTKEVLVQDLRVGQ